MLSMQHSVSNRGRLGLILEQFEALSQRHSTYPQPNSTFPHPNLAFPEKGHSSVFFANVRGRPTVSAVKDGIFE